MLEKPATKIAHAKFVESDAGAFPQHVKLLACVIQVDAQEHEYYLRVVLT